MKFIRLLQTGEYGIVDITNPYNNSFVLQINNIYYYIVDNKVWRIENGPTEMQVSTDYEVWSSPIGGLSIDERVESEYLSEEEVCSALMYLQLTGDYTFTRVRDLL